MMEQSRRTDRAIVCVIDLDDGTEVSPRVWRAGLKSLDGGYDLTLTLSQALCETFE
jgi:hypothetical protein